MSKATKSAGGQSAAQPGMPFEEALKKLEAIVDSMESDELPLETLLARFEEGSQLARVCQTKLAEAETKVRSLEKTAGGEWSLQPLPLSGEPAED